MHNSESLRYLKQENLGSARAYMICGLAALFYLYEFVLQVSPGVMTEPLMRDLSVDAAGLGDHVCVLLLRLCADADPGGYAV